MNSSTLPASHRHTVSGELGGERLDILLSTLPGIVSREMARRLILHGAVHLNGAVREPSSRVHTGDEVAYRIPPPQSSLLPPEEGPLEILHEDRSLIVIDKPAGVPMHPGPGHRGGTLVNFLLAHCSDLSGIGGTLRPGIVHRLDMDTTGVVVIAKSDAAHKHLAAQFKAHSIHREYQALVVGKPPGEEGFIDLPLDRHRTNRFKRTVTEGGKRAKTLWWVKQRLGRFTQLRVRLETGRTHQIRVHMAHAGWPVLGDPLYGEARHRGLDLPPELIAALNRFPRQALHASELGFDHPVSGETLHFASPLPADMQALVELLAGQAGS